MIQHGIVPSKKDHRTYSFHRTFGGILPKILTIPDEFDFDAGLGVPDQDADGLSLGCTGYTSSELCQDEDNIAYLPKYTYDKTLEMSGISENDPQFERVGCQVKDSMKSVLVYGVQDRLNTDPFTRRRGAYYDVLNGSDRDCFDSIRSAMYKNFELTGKKHTVSIGTPWFPEWNQSANGVISNSFLYSGRQSDYPWHNWKISGVKKINGELYLIGKTWQGKLIGDKGLLYFSRATINRALAISGTSAMMFAPLSQGNVETVKLSIIETILSYFRMWFSKVAKLSKPPVPATVAPTVAQDAPATVSTPTEAPVAPSVAPKSTLNWDDYSDARHSTRLVCDAMGLTYSRTLDPATTDKEVICACIEQESNFNRNAVNHNKDAQGVILSTDYGLCQINDHYHIGPGKEFSSPQEVLNDPEKSVRYMIGQAKIGQLKLWVSYSSGAYKKYLPK